MLDKNIEMMKKIIEEKKKKGIVGTKNLRPDKTMGGKRKAIINKKTGGLFDK